MSYEPLAADFPTPTYAEWQKLAAAKEKDPEAPLVTALEEGLSTAWLYGPDDALAADPAGLPGEAPYVRGSRVGAPWAIRQRNGATDPKAANDQILEDLEGGATEVLLAIDPAGVEGIPVSSVEQLDEVLTGVHLDLAPVALEGDPTAAEHLLELYRRRGTAPEEVRPSLRLNPIGRGRPDLEAAIAAVAETAIEFPHARVLAADSEPYVEDGAGPVLELALLTATAVAYLRAGDEAGISPDAIASALEFTVVTGPDQFLEIAKLRAARRLWASVLEHSGVAPERRRSPLYARTSRRMVSSLDPWVNLLRATTSSFAAAVGGADGITVLPFDEPIGERFTEPGALGRRMARNTQLLLAEESNLHRVADPAGGSWYVESLTDQIAQAAWSQFQEIERAGGITAFDVEERLAAATAARHDAISRRTRSLTGVNQFPLLGDDGLERPTEVEALEATTSRNRRDAAQFEALRVRAAKLDPAPKLLLACVGPLSAHVSASLWGKSFFEAGGIETVTQREDDLDPAGFSVAAVCVGKDADPGPVVEKLREVPKVYAVGGDVEGLERVRDGVDMVAVLGALLDELEQR